VDIIVEFGGGEGSRKKGNRMNFSVSIDNGKNYCKHIIGGVCSTISGIFGFQCDNTEAETKASFKD
jgi:hypothetical protein